MPEKPTTVAQYVKALDPARRKDFDALRKRIKKELPEARERIVHGMPHFVMGEPVCGIAAQKRYFSLYLCTSRALDTHRADFAHLDVGKCCIRFRSPDDLPEPATRSLLRAARKEFQ